jgi:hypothetical protein
MDRPLALVVMAGLDGKIKQNIDFGSAGGRCGTRKIQDPGLTFAVIARSASDAAIVLGRAAAAPIAIAALR